MKNDQEYVAPTELDRDGFYTSTNMTLLTELKRVPTLFESRLISPESPAGTKYVWLIMKECCQDS